MRVSRALRNSLVASLCAPLLLILAGCTVCNEQITGETVSPDRTWTTRTTTRSCTYAVPTTDIYLQRADSRARLGEIVVLVRNVHAVMIAWKSSTEVHVDCPRCGADVKISRPSAHGITISVSR